MIVDAAQNPSSCQYTSAVKIRTNFNIHVDNIVEIRAITGLRPLLIKIYTECTHVSALASIYFYDERIALKTSS
jgi:hypothetical protein